MTERAQFGMIGLGVMGGPMCRNIVAKHGGPVHVFDLDPVAVEDLRAAGAHVAATVADVARVADVVFLSLPGGKQVEQVCLGADGLAGAAKAAASASRIAERVIRVLPVEFH